MIVRALFSVVFLLSLAACASSPTNTENGQFENATTIQGYNQLDGLTTWLHIRILSVDGKLMDYGLFGGFGKTFLISPGNNSVAVELTADSGFGGACPCKAIELFTLVSKPGHAYRIKAQLDGDNATLWIEDLATNEPVTPVINLRPRGI